MPNTPRPSLDPITIFRAEQVARAENRTLANSIKQLVAEAWSARQEAKLRAALGGRDLRDLPAPVGRG
jgi:hypothetical protein